MKAVIKGVISPDVEDLKLFRPEQKDSFSIFLQVLVGPFGLEGEEAFNVQICTPLWLLQKNNVEDILIGRGLLIVQQYNYDQIVATLNKFCENCEGETWQEVAIKVSRIGSWEFEDYQD